MPNYRHPFAARRHPRAWFLTTLTIIFVVLGGAAACIDYAKNETRIATVCDKERVATDNGGEYRIYTDKGTFVMKDSLIGGVRFDTADAYAKIKPDTTYRLTTKGWRIPFLSTFPNIMRAAPLPEAEQTPEACS